MKFNFFKIVPALALILIAACGNNTEECTYGTPTPIFSEAMESVTEHHFEKNQQQASEEVVFRNGQEVEILQSGCDQIIQEFRFRIPLPRDQNPNWFLLAGEQLLELSQQDTTTQSLSQWANVLTSNAGRFQLGAPLEVMEGFFIKVDKIISSDQILLIIELSQK